MLKLKLNQVDSQVIATLVNCSGLYGSTHKVISEDCRVVTLRTDEDILKVSIYDTSNILDGNEILPVVISIDLYEQSIICNTNLDTIEIISALMTVAHDVPLEVREKSCILNEINKLSHHSESIHKKLVCNTLSADDVAIYETSLDNASRTVKKLTDVLISRYTEIDLVLYDSDVHYDGV